MFLDLAPVTTQHMVWLGVAFAVVYGLLAILLKLKKPRLRVAKGKVVYAGVLIVSTVALINSVLIEDLRLRAGMIAVAFLTLLIGIMDEERELKPLTQLGWQFLIVAVAVSWGWTIRYVSNPWGAGVIDLSGASVAGFILPGSLLAIGWLLLLINAMNWLDGVDGLASGVGVVALFTLAAVSLLPSTQDSMTLSLALVGAGATLGFLVWNWSPARVYLGTTGSWFIGLYIGMVAIVGGGKIVTTLLVLAIPVIDLGSVTVQRLLAGSAPWRGDTVRHLHHRLLAKGWSPQLISAAAMSLTAILGVIAIGWQTKYKVVALFTAIIVIVVLSLILMRSDENRTVV